ncbi:hypothetical protein CEXT_25571 [Caerostris extrusa]|uniref:Secreted protein n=1 Tax=Caerostris extrusa TaxID=172846 RepID=A0AAV4Y5Y7_CAEEX|nr:hypothetical protein CEXT_25571 [Caerostris extrusa]
MGLTTFAIHDFIPFLFFFFLPTTTTCVMDVAHTYPQRFSTMSFKIANLTADFAANGLASYCKRIWKVPLGSIDWRPPGFFQKGWFFFYEGLICPRLQLAKSH